jgi:hypothetical protein
LNKKRETITFKEVVVAEGSNSILDDMKAELVSLQHDTIIIDQRLKDFRCNIIKK